MLTPVSGGCSLAYRSRAVSPKDRVRLRCLAHGPRHPRVAQAFRKATPSGCRYLVGTVPPNGSASLLAPATHSPKALPGHQFVVRLTIAHRAATSLAMKGQA
jgi:hypothetical protein